METPNPPVDNTDALNRLQIKLTENKANAQESVDRFTEKLRKDIEVGDVNFNKGLIRMTKTYLENSISVTRQLSSVFQKHSEKTVCEDESKCNQEPYPGESTKMVVVRYKTTTGKTSLCHIEY